MKIFYSPDYVRARFAFDTTRKAQWLADDLCAHPLEGFALCSPAPLSETQLLAVHDAKYVSAIRTGTPRSLAATTELEWDAGLWTMALAVNGGMVAAALSALQDGVACSLSSGLHHARRERGAGFCTFNGLVLAARAALAAGAQPVLVLDLDAHCGGGTHSLVADDDTIWQLDVATHLFDGYAPMGHNTLDLIDDARDYLPTLEARLEALPSFGLCLYNAGVDSFEGCELGGLADVTQEMLAERERMVFAWARRRGVPIAFAPAGGYVGDALSHAQLVALHRQTIEAALTCA